jgi:hypothetical protein
MENLLPRLSDEEQSAIAAIESPIKTTALRLSSASIGTAGSNPDCLSGVKQMFAVSANSFGAMPSFERMRALLSDPRKPR